jgi:hypothetical protein
LGKWIGENLQEELGFPDKEDKRAQPGTGWTPAEFNSILHDHIVAGDLITFGCVEWQSQLFLGVMRLVARFILLTCLETFSWLQS